MIQLDGIFCLGMALMLLILPLRWVLAAVAAAMVHEFCHVVAVVLLQGKITAISIRPGGCVMETDRMEPWRQFFSILAGPVGSLLLLLFRRTAPELAICGLFHGLFNLLPVLPVDGGRLLLLLLSPLPEDKAEKLRKGIVLLVCVGELFVGIWVFRYQKFFGILTLLLGVRTLARNISCNAWKSKVQ